MTKKIIIGGRHKDLIPTDNELRELDAQAKITFSNEQRTAIANALQMYSIINSLYRQAPRVSAVVPILKEIARTANHLAALLNTTDSINNKGAFAQLNLCTAFNRHQCPDLNIFKVRDEVRQLAEAAAFAAHDVGAEADVGAPGDPFVAGLIVELIEIHKEAGGAGPYSKPSLAFLRHACGLAGRTIGTDDAMIKQVKRALGQRSG